jgi:phosphohistidine swiveling domain-containing protein
MRSEPLQPPGTDAFPLEWRDPGDASLTWEWDDMHAPFALSPLAGDYFEVISEGFSYRYQKLEIPARMLGRVWNGYAYFAFDWGVPKAEQEATQFRSIAGRKAAVPLASAYWREQALPELRAIYEHVDGVPVADLEPSDLADAWEEAWRRCGRAWEIHFYAIIGPYQALDDLADVYESVVSDAPPGEALRLVHGRMEELQAVEAGVSELARLAASEATLAARLRGSSSRTIESLAAMPEAAAFVKTLEAFLTHHGHMGQGFDDLAQASWSEEPERLLAEVAKRLEHPHSDTDARRAAVGPDAEALVASVRERLSGNPDDLEQFERALGFARDVGPLTEGHNYWIDRRVQATLRRFCMSVARRLVDLGVMEDAADVFFLHRSEVPDLLRAPVDCHDLIAARRAELDRQLALTPPRVIGQPPEEEPGGRFDGIRIESTDRDLLKGTGASAGRASGPARVTLSPDDFARVQAGDIIICPSSNPSWVPLFSIAAGLVTDTGGVLSHAAVVAREFGLPAVVGTGDATTRIADGRTVELDGTTGDVRLR